MLKNFLSENFRLNTKQLLEGLTVTEQELLMASGVTHMYKKGEIIFREGGIPTGIFYIKSGRVKKYKTTSKGTEQIFYLCSQGELLGYHALLGEQLYMDSAATVEDSQISFIPKDIFLKMMRSSTAFSNALLKALGHEFSFFMNSIVHLASKPVRERLALNLLILDEKYKSDERSEISSDINLSRTDMANLVGTAKETLVRLLLEFQQAGLIEKDGRVIRIVDRKKTIRAANLKGLNPKKA